jgi:hypothetical protein
VRSINGRSSAAGAEAGSRAACCCAAGLFTGFGGRLLPRSSPRRPLAGPVPDFWPGRRSFCLNVVFRVLNLIEPVQIASHFHLGKALSRRDMFDKVKMGGL